MKNEIIKELEQISSPLVKFKKQKEGFEVPKDYFSQLQTAVWKELNPQVETSPRQAPSEEVQPGVQRSWWQQTSKTVSGWLQAPAVRFAMVAILLGAGLLFVNRSTPETLPTAMVMDISSDEATDYLAAHLDDFDTETLIEIGLEEDVFLSEDSPFFDNQEMDAAIDELLQENLDFETLNGIL